jgi:calcium binding protein
LSTVWRFQPGNERIDVARILLARKPAPCQTGEIDPSSVYRNSESIVKVRATELMHSDRFSGCVCEHVLFTRAGFSWQGTLSGAGPEQAMSWYYYLESKIRFPFHAKCLAAKGVSPLRKGESVEVVRMAMLVMIRWQGRNVAVPLSQLTAIDPDESTAEAIGDWHYWVA